jgi:hypothetical protein
VEEIDHSPNVARSAFLVVRYSGSGRMARAEPGDRVGMDNQRVVWAEDARTGGKSIGRAPKTLTLPPRRAQITPRWMDSPFHPRDAGDMRLPRSSKRKVLLWKQVPVKPSRQLTTRRSSCWGTPSAWSS